MKKNLFIFAVSIISVLGVYSGARANVASADYVTEQLKGKLDDKNEVIQQKHLATDIMKKINDAYDGLANKLDKTYDEEANKYKVLTVGEDGNVIPDLVKIPIGQNATGGVAQIWIEQ